MSAPWVSGLLLSQMTISSYRRKIRTLYFFSFFYGKFVFSAFLAVWAKMSLIRAQYTFKPANINSFFPWQNKNLLLMHFITPLSVSIPCNTRSR